MALETTVIGLIKDTETGFAYTNANERTSLSQRRLMNSEPKSEQLYQTMKHDILMLRLAPGSALRLPTLSEQYSIGLTPLRDCLGRLSRDYLVQTEHNKGFRVAPLSMNDLANLERSRAVIEGALFVEAVQTGTEDWEAAVVGTFHNLQKVTLPSVLQNLEDIDNWVERHAAFHHALTSAADNPWMSRYSAGLGDQLQRYHQYILQGIRELGKDKPDKAKRAAAVFTRSMAIEPHRILREAALDRKPGSAQAAFAAHSQMSLKSYGDVARLLADPQLSTHEASD